MADYDECFVMEAVPHIEQRYDTVGDWVPGRFAGEPTIIRVSRTGNSDYDFLVMLHELIEYKLCQKRGISDQLVMAFDVAYQGDDEPGDDDEAPYQKEHQFATVIEHMMARELEVDWDDYNKTLDEVELY